MVKYTKGQLIALLKNAPDDAKFSGWDDGTIYMDTYSGSFYPDEETGEWQRYYLSRRIVASPPIEGFRDL